MRRGRGATPPLHPRRRGAARHAVGAVAPGPAARTRAGDSAVRADQPPGRRHRGRSCRGRPVPGGSRCLDHRGRPRSSRDRRTTPWLGHHLGHGHALRRHRPVAPPRPGERRPLPPAHARRPRVRRGDPAPVTHQPRGPAGGGAQPAPSGVSARGARLASHAHHLTGGARVHRVRPPRRRVRRHRSGAGSCRAPIAGTDRATILVR